VNVDYTTAIAQGLKTPFNRDSKDRANEP
jgi:hypothetical protein